MIPKFTRRALCVAALVPALTASLHADTININFRSDILSPTGQNNILDDTVPGTPTSFRFQKFPPAAPAYAIDLATPEGAYTGINTYSGDTIIQDGLTLLINRAENLGVIGTTSDTRKITLGGFNNQKETLAVAADSTVTLNQQVVISRPLSGYNFSTQAAINVGAGSTLTLNRLNAATGTSGVWWEKTGAGTLVLAETGVGPFFKIGSAGQIALTEGTLRLDKTALGSDIVVSAGATLTGTTGSSDTITGIGSVTTLGTAFLDATSARDAMYSNTSGFVVRNAVTLSSETTTTLRLNANAVDVPVVQIGGAAQLDGTLVITTAAGYSAVAGTTYKLLQVNPANLTRFFSGVQLDTSVDGLAWDTSNFMTQGTIRAVATTVVDSDSGFENTGTLTGLAGAAAIFNNGQLTQGGAGLTVVDGAGVSFIKNAAGATITGGTGVTMLSGEGASGGAGVDLQGGSFDNFGAVTGGKGGDLLATAPGMPAGTGGHGVLVGTGASFASVTNGSADNTGATITGGKGGALLPGSDAGALPGAGGAGVYADTQGVAVVNYGVISGGDIGGDASAPAAARGGAAVNFSVNAGGAILNNNAGAVLNAGAGGSPSARLAVVANATMSQLVNAGTINGNVSLNAGGNVYLRESGVLNGNLNVIVTDNPARVSLSAGTKINGSLAFNGMIGGEQLELTGDAGTVGSLAQSITGTLSGQGGIVKSGAGTWIVDKREGNAPFNALPESWRITGGTLEFGDAAATLGLDSAMVNVQLNGGALRFAGTQIAETSSSFGIGVNGSGAIDVAEAGHEVAVLASVVGLSNNGVGVTLTKTGAGTLKFDGNALYSGLFEGAVVVDAGTLKLDNVAIANGDFGDVTVNDGARLVVTNGGEWRNLTVNGAGKLDIVASDNSLRLDSLNLSSATETTVFLNGYALKSDYDQAVIRVSGTSHFDGTVNLRFDSGFTGTKGQSFRLVDVDSDYATVGNTFMIGVESPGAGLNWDTALLLSEGYVSIIATPGVVVDNNIEYTNTVAVTGVAGVNAPGGDMYKADDGVSGVLVRASYGQGVAGKLINNATILGGKGGDIDLIAHPDVEESGNGGSGVELQGGELVNNGVIRGGDAGALDPDEYGSRGDAGSGVVAGSGAKIVNNAGALISGGMRGDEIGAPAIAIGGDGIVVENAGRIEGGVLDQSGHTATVRNLAGGVITTGNAGLFGGQNPAIAVMNLTLENAGTIEGAVFAADAAITNTGTLTGDISADRLTLTNSGTVAGNLFSNAITLVNRGAIIGDVTGTLAGDTVFGSGSRVEGKVEVFLNDPLTVTLDATARIGGDFFLFPTGSDTLTLKLDGAAGTSGSLAEVIGGSFALSGARLLKSGAGDWNFTVGSGLSVNTYRALEVAEGRLTLEGPQLTFQQGVTLSGGELVLGDGLMLRSDPGHAVVTASGNGVVATISGAGTVHAQNGEDGALVTDGATLHNAATILGGDSASGFAGDGVRIEAGSKLVNENGGLVRAGAGSLGGGLSVRLLGDGATFVNHGTVDAAQAGSGLGGNGTAVWGTYLSASPDAVVSFTNAGTVNGNAHFEAKADVTLVAGGVINGDLNLLNESTLRLDGAAGTTQSLATAVTGDIQLSGTLVKQGAGTWVLDRGLSASTPLPGIAVKAGTLELGDAAAGLGFGLAPLDVTLDGGAVRIAGTQLTGTTAAIVLGETGGTVEIADAANTFTVSNAVTGTGGLTKTGAGTLKLDGANTYAGLTHVAQGTLDLSVGSITGGVQVDTGAKLVSTTPVSVGGSLNNTGTIVSDVTVTGASTTLNPGSQIQGDLNYGGGTLTITTAPTQPTPTPTSQLVTGTLTGTGGITLSGGGSLTIDSQLPAAPTVTGGTTVTISNPALAPGMVLNGGSAVIMPTFPQFTQTPYLVDVVANPAPNTLTFNGQSLPLLTTFTGGGDLTLDGPGTVLIQNQNLLRNLVILNTLSLGAAQNTAAYLQAHMVEVMGNLRGYGTIASNVVNSGTVAPGNSPGVITIVGDYSQTSTGTLDIEIAGTGAGQHDVLQYSGTAHLDGTLNIIHLAGYTPTAGDRVLFLEDTAPTAGAADIVGAFATENLPALTGALSSMIVRTENGLVYAVYIPGASAFGSGALHSGTTSFADALAGYSPTTFNALLATQIASGNAALAKAVTAASPIGLSGQEALVLDETRSTARMLRDRAEDRLTGDQWQGFVTGRGAVTDWKSDSNNGTFDHNFGGGSGGLARAVGSSGLSVGLAAGYDSGRADLHDGAGKLEQDRGSVTAYTAYSYSENGYVYGGVTGGYSAWDTKRTHLLGTDKGDTDGFDVSATFGAGHRIRLGDRFDTTPYAALTYLWSRTEGFSESGTALALNVKGREYESLRARIGDDFGWTIPAGSQSVRLSLGVAYERELLDDDVSVGAVFANGSGFGSRGRVLSKDVISVTPAISWNFTAAQSVRFGYSYEYGFQGTTSNRFDAAYTVKF